MADITQHVNDTLPTPMGTAGYYTTSTAITSQQMMLDYIDRKLGGGLVRIEATAQAINDGINEAIEYYCQYTTHDRAYMLIDLGWFATSACTDGSMTLPDNVTSVFAVESDVRGTGVNTLFTLENQMYMAGYFDFRNFDLVSWELVSEWMKLKDLVLGQKLGYYFDYRLRKFYPVPRITTAINMHFCVIGVYLRPPAEALWNKPWVREYATESARLRVGEVRFKYGATNLLGGGTIDGSAWITRAEANLKTLKDELYELTMDNDPVDLMMG
jgi:hypothetical protein